MSRGVNARQLEVLRWVAEGCPDGRWPADDFTYKTSVGALQGRGLATVKGHRRTWSASITDTGTYYLEHGEYPPGHGASKKTGAANVNAADERAPGQSPAFSAKVDETLAEAKDLIRVLREDGSLELRDPAESKRAHYRRLLHACREHHLVPSGLELRYTGRDAGDIVIALVDGSEKANSDWLRIRTTARRITTNVDALRSALENHPRVLRVSEALRPRAIEFAVALANELPAHGLRLGVNVKLKTPKLFIEADGRRRDVHVLEVKKDVPHVRTPEEEREARRNPWKTFPTIDSVASGVLRVTIGRDGWDSAGQHKKDQWSDKSRTPLEQQARLIAREIKAGIVDDIDERDRQKQAQAKQLEEFDRKRAAERAVWETIRRAAYAKAQQQLRQAAFAEVHDSWMQASELRHFCDELEAAIPPGDDVKWKTAHTWTKWARSRADELDPTMNLELLNGIDFEAKPTEEDLRPSMEGWSPSGPHKDYSAMATSRASSTSEPTPWHPGLRNKPTWWR